MLTLVEQIPHLFFMCRLLRLFVRSSCVSESFSSLKLPPSKRGPALFVSFREKENNGGQLGKCALYACQLE